MTGDPCTNEIRVDTQCSPSIMNELERINPKSRKPFVLDTKEINTHLVWSK